MILRPLSIRMVMVTLGALAVLVAAGLAGFGLWAATLEMRVQEEAATLEQAVRTHSIADALFDDIRADVQRALLTGAHLNNESVDELLTNLHAHVEELGQRISENSRLTVSSAIDAHYAAIEARLEHFAKTTDTATTLAAVDPVAGAKALGSFRQSFADVDQHMDDVRDLLNEAAFNKRMKRANVLQQVRWLILGSFLGGATILSLLTAAAVSLGHKITGELAESKEEAHQLALHDPLTKLPNRALLYGHLEQALASVQRDGQSLAMLCLDLDRFKSVNDTLGHSVGDELLRAVAMRLTSCLRRSDLVARLGGDEFVIIQSPVTSIDEAGAFAQRVIDILTVPYILNDHHVVIGASVGIAIGPSDAADPHGLLKMADLALYRAKSDGRGCFRSFEPGMDARLQARCQIALKSDPHFAFNHDPSGERAGCV